MKEILIWLSERPIVANSLLVTLGVIALSIVLIYLVAFFQGREISFYPPKIGPKWLGSESGKDIKSSEKDELIVASSQLSTQEGMKIVWPPSSSPNAQTMLSDVKRSLLLIGTSNIRIMRDDFFKYREWLAADKERFFGIIFLNPHSPHAFHRDRKNVSRSSIESITESIKIAYTEAKNNPQFIPVIYDGPYRYSARASDIDVLTANRDMGKIDIFTSSIQHGTSGGFKIGLTYVKPSDVFSFYKQDILEIWKQSLANPAGHGISIIYRIEPLFSETDLERNCEILESTLGEPKCETLLFSMYQLHVSLASLCRTQRNPLAGPFSINVKRKDENLPLHFEEFINKIIANTEKIQRSKFDLIFNQIFLDNRGQVVLIGDEKHSAPFRRQANEFLKFVSHLIIEMSEKYPREPWGEISEDTNEPRFGPKYDAFMPHMTIGMLFDKHGIPIPVKGKSLSVQLPTPIRCEINCLSLVHYAYRTLLRCVGELQIPDGLESDQKESEIMSLLHLQ